MSLRGLAQLLAVEFFGPAEQVIEGLQAVLLLSVSGGFRAAFRNFHAGTTGQLLDRFREALMLVFHQETHRIAGGATAKAVVELLVRRHGEGRGLFLMEGAAGAVIAAGFFQGHAGVDQLHQIGAGQ